MARQTAGLLREQNSALRQALTAKMNEETLGLDYDQNWDNFANTNAGKEEWVRFEIYLAWIARASHGEWVTSPMPNYEVGGEFVETVIALTHGKKNKAVRAIIDILTLNPTRLSAREVHPLRSGDGAYEAPLVRGDGARCLRAYI